MGSAGLANHGARGCRGQSLSIAAVDGAWSRSRWAAAAAVGRRGRWPATSRRTATRRARRSASALRANTRDQPTTRATARAPATTPRRAGAEERWRANAQASSPAPRVAAVVCPDGNENPPAAPAQSGRGGRARPTRCAVSMRASRPSTHVAVSNAAAKVRRTRLPVPASRPPRARRAAARCWHRRGHRTREVDASRGAVLQRDAVQVFVE